MTANILAVDDEPDMLKLLSMIVREKTPHNIVTTNNPLEALEIAKRGGIDLLIADLKMPGLDGSELLDAVKAVDQDIPVVIITAFATEEAAADTLQKGGFDFIIKPFRKEQILGAIDKALKWAQMQKENRELREKLKGSGS
jgi:DNA-binding NtrC family response regulator